MRIKVCFHYMIKVLTKGYILFRCHHTNVLTPKVDEDTENVGC